MAPEDPFARDALPTTFVAGLPRMQVAAGCLLVDEDDRILLVKPTYKRWWEIPGGAVEVAESPLDGCRRELTEELGLDRCPGRLLCLDYRRGEDGRPDALRIVFDGGVVSAADIARVRLPADELSDWRFVEAVEMAALVRPVLARRLDAAYRARRNGDVAYLEDGREPAAWLGVASPDAAGAG